MTDAWGEAWSKLTSALEHAQEAGLTEIEAVDAVTNVYGVVPENYTGGGPKRPKPEKAE